MDQTVIPSKIRCFFFLIMFLPALFHNGWFLRSCLAEKSPFDITTDTSSLIAFRDHLVTTSSFNNILRDNWTSPTSVCHWIGVTCSTRHRRVVALDLGNMGLHGTIPSHLGNLSFLLYLDFSNNKFYGKLPEVLARLHRLSFINVDFNSFGGNILSRVGFLPQLKYIYLQNNSFVGPIPPSLSNCSKLEVLDMSYNLLSGTIPQQIGNLYNLKSFLITGNQLSGALPHSIFNISSLETFRLTGNGISGSLPANMCTSLSKLRFLSASNNELDGPVPSGLQFCSRLETLALSYNKLEGPLPGALGNLTMLNILFLGGNKLEGDIPNEFANLVNLKRLGLERAGIGGSIPPFLFKNLTSLEALNLPFNSFSRSIPQEIGNCTTINYIDAAFNHLTGQIPESIVGLHNLEFLSLSANNLGGHVPANLFNITSLGVLALPENHFNGDLPSTIGFGLPNIEQLLLGLNQFSGTIPDSICNASGLIVLDLGRNNFMGSPPIRFGKLRLLESLIIGENNFKLKGATFIYSLNSCKRLYDLEISFSEVNGPLPSSFGNLTSSLEVFSARGCRITGNIPQDIRKMSNLRSLDLSLNQLVGSLPNTLHGLSNLEEFSASENNLSGPVPDDICNLPRLGFLDLHMNKFSGSLPNCLGNITTLRSLILSINELSGSIPSNLWTLKDILRLDLSSNAFTGYLPPHMENLEAAIYINLSMNQLWGTLPSEIGSLQSSANFSLAHNKFEGSIPQSFGKLLSMVELDLSHNNLSGEIPKSLEALSLLKILGLSSNNLFGEIPSAGPFKNLTYRSFESNQGLCGSPRFLVPQCQSDGSSKHLTKRKKVILFAYAFIGMILLTLGVLTTLYVILKYKKNHLIPLVDDLQPAVTHERIPYYELLQATSSFDDRNLLGEGSFGSVYKGVSSNGRIWAVKVFHMQVGRALRSFNTECEMLRNIRHRNLTKVISSCTNLDFMALVLEYMPNGSLHSWLYSQEYIMDAKKRLDIMIDVASALDYLHHGYSVPVVHCDIKPSNVLLDEDMVAHVSDFGISKFLKDSGSIVQTNTLATIGYTAPEYGREGLVSTKCDVYSFGIMLMEVFTRKRPTEEMFNGDLDLKLWIKQSLPDRVMEVIDGDLVREKEQQVDAMLHCVSAILELACNCSADSPEDRMNMNIVLATLQKIKYRFLSNATSSS